MEVIRVIPLDEVIGRIRTDNDKLIFQAQASDAIEEVFGLSKATELFKRVYKLLNCGIEITTLEEDGAKTLFVTFAQETHRNELYD